MKLDFGKMLEELLGSETKYGPEIPLPESCQQSWAKMHERIHAYIAAKKEVEKAEIFLKAAKVEFWDAVHAWRPELTDQQCIAGEDRLSIKVEVKSNAEPKMQEGWVREILGEDAPQKVH